MSLYLEQIRQLVALQRVDDAIHSVEMELDQAPKELEDLKNRFAATNTQRERVLEKLAHLKEQEKRITGELDDDSRSRRYMGRPQGRVGSQADQPRNAAGRSPQAFG